MNKDYAYNPDNDSNLINGIVINKPISINGNNHYVDGKNVSSSFYITNYNVNLWNVNLLNNPGLYTAGSNSYIELMELIINDSVLITIGMLLLVNHSFCPI